MQRKYPRGCGKQKKCVFSAAFKITNVFPEAENTICHRKPFVFFILFYGAYHLLWTIDPILCTHKRTPRCFSLNISDPSTISSFDYFILMDNGCASNRASVLLSFLETLWCHNVAVEKAEGAVEHFNLRQSGLWFFLVLLDAERRGGRETVGKSNFRSESVWVALTFVRPLTGKELPSAELHQTRRNTKGGRKRGVM